MTARTEAVARELADGGLKVAPGTANKLRTRSKIREAWKILGDILVRQNQPELAQQIRQFVDRMSPPLTEKEAIAARLVERARENARRDRGSLSR